MPTITTPLRSSQRSVDARTGDERIRVQFRRDDGALVESDTTIGKDRVRAEIAVTDARGARDAWVFEDDFRDDRRDLVQHVTAGGQKETGFSPALFLAKRAELFADRSSTVEPGALPGTYAAEYTSAVLLSSGRDRTGAPAHVLASLGTHASFPFPGEHWDEGQLAILDRDLRPTLTLRMPKDAEATHLDITFSDEGPERKRIRYQGWMEDDHGKLHFVQADYLLDKHAVVKQHPSLWERVVGAINGALGFEQHAALLRELKPTASRLLIDGDAVIDIERTTSAIDDGARFHALAKSRLVAVNYAPEQSPLLSLVDPGENETRYRFDATLLFDGDGLLHKLLPSLLRRGTLAGHYVVDSDGKRRDVEEQLVIDGPPLSSKSYTWELDGRPVARLQRDLVRVRDGHGSVELGFREIIRKI